MFDRVRIKELAKNALRRRYWVVVLVCILVGLLGGNLAGGLTAGGRVDLSTNWMNNANVDMDMDADVDIPNAGIWDSATPDNPWMDGGNQQQGGSVWDPATPDNPWVDGGNQQQGGTVWDNPTEHNYDSWSDVWDAFTAEWNRFVGDIQGQWNAVFESIGNVVGLILIIMALLGTIVMVLYTIFVGNTMTVGGHGWMLRHWRGEEVTVGETFAAFRIYKPSVVTMLVRGIYIWLWSLLFIIPGIVKTYAYSMVPYIIYENPNLTANQAIKMSKKMTNGYKFDLFVLGLSFIGWQFLSAITGGVVGLFWANPYMGLTHAGVYEDLKWRAIQNGTLTWEDFGQLPPPPMDPFEPGWGNPAPTSPWDTPAATPDASAEPASTVWHNPSDIHW